MVRVLLVDDDDATRAFLRRVLEADGFDVIEAREGYEGYALAKQEAPSLILMDLMMPGVDGFLAVDLLKTDPVTDSIPVVAVTGLRMAGDLREAERHPFDGYVTKPFRMRDFRGLVTRILEAHGIAPPSPHAAVAAPAAGGG